MAEEKLAQMEAGAKAFDAHELAGRIKKAGREMGFDLVGIAPATASIYGEYLKEWLGEGKAGTMGWLGSRVAERTDPAAYLPGAKCIICVAANYYTALEKPTAQYAGKVARYALGADYHEVIKGRLYRLSDWLKEMTGAQTRACVDTAPVMEKEASARAGVGWIGKNTCLINERIGSWLLLGEIVTTADLPVDTPAVDRCGTCTRCIEACPTGAITAPYQMDARKCISYLTIEHREEIEPELRRQMGDWIYGCDICQDVCPWNGRAPVSADEAWRPRFASGTLDVREVAAWTDEAYRAALRGSAMKRVKLPVLKRNARIVLENLGGV